MNLENIVQHSRSKTKQEALEQSALDINKDTIYFTTDDHTIVMGGEEYSKCKVGNLDGYISQDATFLNRTTAGSISIAEQADGDIAQMTAVRGNSLVWNQLAAYGNFTDVSKLSHDKDVSLSVSNNVLTVTRTAEYYNGGAIHTISSIYNHKYYCSVLAKTDANNGDAVYNNIVFYLNVGGNNVNVTGNLTTNWQRFSVIREAGATESSPISSTNTIYMYNRYTDLGSKVYFRDLILVDLSLMYGIGNEPDKATFEQWLNTHYPHGYYEYNKGEVISVKPTGIKTVGFNLMDLKQKSEEYDGSKLSKPVIKHDNSLDVYVKEQSASYGTWLGGASGEAGSQQVGTLIDERAKSVTMPVLPNTKYMFRCTSNSNDISIRFDYQTFNKDYISVVADEFGHTRNQIFNGETFTTPSDCYYITNAIYLLNTTAGKTYNIKLSLHQVTTDDTIDVYQPYWSETTPINVTSLVGTKSDGTEEIMFPDGLMGIGEYKDEIKGNKAVKRIGKVDLSNSSLTDWIELNTRGTFRYEKLLYSINTADKPSYKIISNKYVGKGEIRLAGSTEEGNVHAQQVYISDEKYANNRQGFVDSLNGVYAYYQLEEPIEYTLKTPFSVTYKADDYGTESILPDNGNNTPLTLPIEATIKYGVNVLGELENLPYNYVATYPQNLTDLQKETARHNIGVDLDRYAEKNGTYLDMTVGNAVNLEGGNEIVNNSAARPTGGNEDVTFDSSSVIKIEGNSVAWNQLVKAPTLNVERIGITVTSDAKTNKITVKGTAEQSGGRNTFTFGTIDAIKGHKLYCRCPKFQAAHLNTWLTDTVDIDKTEAIYGGKTITTITQDFENNKANIGINVVSDTVYDVTDYLMLFDLTLIYGAGKEPTTVEQFELDYQRWFGRQLEYEAYNEGSIRATKATGIKTTGFNLSTITEFEGDIHTWYGNQPSPTNKKLWENKYGYQGQVRVSFDFTAVPSIVGDDVRPGVSFYYTDGTMKNTPNYATERVDVISDEGKIVKDIRPWYHNNGTIKITNFCINFSWSGKRDGEYEPHWEDVASLPITTVTGKLNGEGESVVVFPDGMKRAGDVRDEIFVENGVTKAIKRVGSVDLGSLTFKKRSAAQEWGDYYEADLPDNYSNEDSIYTYIVSILCDKYTATSWGIMCSSGATDKSVCAGDRLRVRDDSLLSTTDTPATKYPNAVVYYPLAEPQVYTLNFSLPVAYRIDDYGTEEIVQPYDSIAPSYVSTYGVNAVDTIRRLPKNYVSVLDQLFTEEQKATARRNIGAVSDEYYNELLKWHSYNNSVSSTTSVSTIPVNARLCIVNTTSGGTFGGTSSITKGQELHVIINNNGSSKITVNIPSTYKCDVESIDIEAGKFGEVNCITDGISIYCRAIGG